MSRDANATPEKENNTTYVNIWECSDDSGANKTPSEECIDTILTKSKFPERGDLLLKLKNAGIFLQSSEESPIYENIVAENRTDLNREIYFTLQYLENMLDSFYSSSESLEDVDTSLSEEENSCEANRLGGCSKEEHDGSPREPKELYSFKPVDNNFTKKRKTDEDDSSFSKKIEKKPVPLPRKSIKSASMINEPINHPRNSLNLNLNFAKVSRESTLFELGIVGGFEVSKPDGISLKDKFNSAEAAVSSWIMEIMKEPCEEGEEFMEEKELLSTLNEINKEKLEKYSENKFPVDDENVELRRKCSVGKNRISKTTDFDLGMRRNEGVANPRNFDIRGLVKLQLPNNNRVLITLNQEYVSYENEKLYRVGEKTKHKEVIETNVVFKTARFVNSKLKDSMVVELKDVFNKSYVLYFGSIKHAKQFMENEKVQVYVDNNKNTIKKALLRFLGKRSSLDILEKKGIYKNEPIFGNTLKEIYNKGGSIVPMFIYKVIELIEKPENITSLGLYRASGNLAIIQKIRFEVDNGRIDILEQYRKEPDVLTGSLKLFFRELREPLVSCEVCDSILPITKIDLKQLTSKNHQTIKCLMKRLEEANLQTFIVIMRHLLNVVRYKEKNKMDTYNMAVCWGPSLIFSTQNGNSNSSAELSKDILSQSHNATRFVDFLLEYYELYPFELNNLEKVQVTKDIKCYQNKDKKSKYDNIDSEEKGEAFVLDDKTEKTKL